MKNERQIGHPCGRCNQIHASLTEAAECSRLEDLLDEANRLDDAYADAVAFDATHDQSGAALALVRAARRTIASGHVPEPFLRELSTAADELSEWLEVDLEAELRRAALDHRGQP